MTFGFSKDYRRIGREVPFGEVSVEYADVLPLHNTVTRDFMDAAPTRSDSFDFDQSSMIGGVYLRHGVDDDFETPARYVSAKMSHASSPEGWRLTAKFTTTNDAARHSNKQVLYRIETYQDEVLSAVKAVKFLFGASDIVIEHDEPAEIVTSTRKMYERPMRAEDCTMLQATLAQAARSAEQVTMARRRRRDI